MPILISMKLPFFCFITFIINLHNCLYIFEYFVICVLQDFYPIVVFISVTFYDVRGSPWHCFASLTEVIVFLFPYCLYCLDFKLKFFHHHFQKLLSRHIFLSARYFGQTNSWAHILMHITNVYACICVWNKIIHIYILLI